MLTARMRCAFVVGLVVVLAAGCSRGPVSIKESIAHDGRTRTYRLFVPASYDGTTPMPLVLVLHGRLGSGRNMEKWSQFSPVAQEKGFIAVYPDGINRQWNNGRGAGARNMTVSDVDDMGFLRALIDSLRTRFRIEEGAVFATGMSNGGMMSHRLACEASDTFAAVAPVVTAMPVELAERCKEGPPVSILMINGTDDWLIPWEGGGLFGREDYGRILSPAATAALWAARNGCTGEPAIATLPASSRRSQVFVETYACGENPVTFYRIEGGGHTWPGGARRQFSLLLGTINRDFEASRVIWEFFDATRSRPAGQG